MLLKQIAFLLSLWAASFDFLYPEAAYSQARSCILIHQTNEVPSSTFRIVRLEKFGIQVRVPENYRAMLNQDGSVSILHPDDFAMLQCIAQGGYGGRGYYSESIELVKPDPLLSLREQAVWSVGYNYDAWQNKISTAEQIIEYNHPLLSGYIVTSTIGNSVAFMGSIAGKGEILQVNVNCDCYTSVEDIITLLSRIQPLD